MCGIFGYVGPRKLTPTLLDGLRKLEYRGYDSAGIAVLPRHRKVSVHRASGAVEELERNLASAPTEAYRDGLGLAHTRWATHGSAEERNAHPHTDCGRKLAVVHNGIIENHRELRRELEARGHRFASDTDSEVLAHLIEESYQGDLGSAVKEVLPRLEGSYALGVIHNGAEPEKIVACRQGSPLVIGQAPGEAFLASDVSALLEHTREVTVLEQGDTAVITRGAVEIFDRRDRPVQRSASEVPWPSRAASKGSFETFMHKEIHEQPEVLAGLLADRGVGAGRVDLDGKLPELEGILGPKRLPERLLVTACGTSYHAGLLAKHLIEELVGLAVTVEVASELQYQRPLVGVEGMAIAISQSGETADTLAALRRIQEAGCPVLAICNVPGSTLVREADASFLTQAGPEIGVASTKAFTTQVLALILVALDLAKRRGGRSAIRARALMEKLPRIPRQVKAVLAREERIEALAADLEGSRCFLYLGRSRLYPVALEGALKLKELLYVPAEGYPAGEMKHGPIALVDEGVPSIFLLQKGAAARKLVGNMEEIAARGGPVIGITDFLSPELLAVADHLIEVPWAEPELVPILQAVVLQLLAYHAALRAGCNVDRPRNLAKSVTVE